MAELLHNALKRSALADALKRALGQHRQGEGGLERWGETLTPIVNIWGLPEWAFLRRETLFAFRQSVGAVAAETSVAALINPTGSNLILVVDAVSGRAQTGTTCALWLQHWTEAGIQGTCTQGNTVVTRDTRLAVNRANIQGWQGTDPSATPLNDLLEERFNGTTTTMDFNSPPYVIHPGRAILVQGSAVNIAIAVNWSGRVRTALPGELVA